jgi:hypothetical protein
MQPANSTFFRQNKYFKEELKNKTVTPLFIQDQGAIISDNLTQGYGDGGW